MSTPTSTDMAAAVASGLHRYRRRALGMTVPGAAALTTGLVGYGASSNHPGGAFTTSSHAWQGLGVAGGILLIFGVGGLGNVRYLRAWLSARSPVPASVAVVGRDDLEITVADRPVGRVRTWTVIWKLARVRRSDSVWFLGDLDRGGAVVADGGNVLVAVTSARLPVRPARRPRP